MKRGWTASPRSKNLMSNGKVVSVPGGQSWMTELHRNVITRSSFFCGQTRSSRVVIPGCAAYGGPTSPTLAGFAGLETSSIRMPGCVWMLDDAWQGCTLPVWLHGADPSVRLPTYTYILPLAASVYRASAAFVPRANSGSCPTSVKFDDVPGVPPAGPTPVSPCADGGANRAIATPARTSSGVFLIATHLHEHGGDPAGPAGLILNGRPDSGVSSSSLTALHPTRKERTIGTTSFCRCRLGARRHQ